MLRKQRNIKPVRTRRRGFTLIEVLIVLAILGVIAAMVVPRFLGQQKGANIKATQSSIHGLEKAIKMYAVDNQGEMPIGGQEVLETLVVPRTDPQTGRTIEPVLESLPLDAWGQLLFYEYQSGGSSKFNGMDKAAIWSSGPDRKNDNGGGDDINNWSNLTNS